uniref:Uncharacterized protein n=1 Tax=Arundo donax TaxID=35708 RepID=A0A0A9H071_ARUDO
MASNGNRTCPPLEAVNTNKSAQVIANSNSSKINRITNKNATFFCNKIRLVGNY